MPVVLIIGAGAGVGQASLDTFAAAGYTVAVASRTKKLDSTKAGFSFFEFDATEPTTVPSLFEKVNKDVGVPSVVIYNGIYLHLQG
jgi:NAD(P)-dependent dehydrogenase (short-subunit alcohol dehydrogenase family)